MASVAERAGRQPVMVGGYAVRDPLAPRPPQAPRAALLAAVIAGHLTAILLLLAPYAAGRRTDTARTLSVFDVAQPPPLPPPPRPDVSPVPTIAATSVDAGGSPTRHRERPTPASAPARAPAAMVFEATITADAPPLPTEALGLDATGIDLGGEADGGTGGVGSGTGKGVGSGSGAGAARYARAEWIRKPVDADFLRVWPTRDVGGKQARQIGWAYLACKVAPGGQPFDCTVVKEQPTAIGGD